MNIVIINGSPKPLGGNSAILVEQLRKQLDNQPMEQYYTVLDIKNSPVSENDYILFETADVLIFAFPLYCDGLPSHLLRQLTILDEWFNSRKGSKSSARGRLTVYALANCGFYDGHNTALALRMVRSWCLRCGLIWGQGMGIGGGELLSNMPKTRFGHGVLKSAGKKMEFFASNIAAMKKGEDIFSSPDMPRLFYVNGANHYMWERKARQNNLTKKQMLYRIP